MGKFPIFLSEMIIRKCNKCKGTGWEESVCHKCNGNKMNLLTGVKCSTCKGVGSFQHRPSKKNPDGSKCKKCKGDGDIKINKQSKKVEKFEKCKHCEGSGKTNCKVSKCVLSFSDGEKLKKVLIKKSWSLYTKYESEYLFIHSHDFKII